MRLGHPACNAPQPPHPRGAKGALHRHQACAWSTCEHMLSSDLLALTSPCKTFATDALCRGGWRNVVCMYTFVYVFYEHAFCVHACACVHARKHANVHLVVLHLAAKRPCQGCMCPGLLQRIQGTILASLILKLVRASYTQEQCCWPESCHCQGASWERQGQRADQAAQHRCHYNLLVGLYLATAQPMTPPPAQRGASHF